MADLDAIRARLAAASPRPWFYNSYNGVESAPMIQADATVEDDWAAAGMPGAVSLRGWIFRCLRRLPRPWSLRLVRAVHRALLATKRMPEPWRTRFRESEPNVCWVPPAYGDTATGRHRADAELIAHAPDDLEALLALVEAREQEIVRLRAVVEQFGRRDHLVNCAVRAPVWVDARRGEAIVTVCYLCQMPYEEHCQPHPCSCGADVHNAAIDRALEGGTDE